MEEENDIVIFGFFDSQDSDEAKAFLTAGSQSDLKFLITTEKDIAAAYDVIAPAIIALRQFDEPRITFGGEFDAKSIVSFAALEAIPLVTEFNEENTPRIFGGSVNVHLILFAEQNADNFDALINAMRTVAKSHRGKILFIHIDSSKDDNLRLCHITAFNI